MIALFIDDADFLFSYHVVKCTLASNGNNFTHKKNQWPRMRLFQSKMQESCDSQDIFIQSWSSQIHVFVKVSYARINFYVPDECKLCPEVSFCCAQSFQPLAPGKPSLEHPLSQYSSKAAILVSLEALFRVEGQKILYSSMAWTDVSAFSL